jgi:hypothetical protein
MLRRIRRRLLPAALLVILAVLVGGVDYAYWSGSGSGAGSATTGTTVPMTLSPGMAASTLYPGGTANIALTVSNPNTFPVHVDSFTLDAALGTGGFAVTGDPGCTVVLATLSFTTTPQTNGGAGWTVPAKVAAVNGTLPVTLANALAMSLDAASACQGATFTVYVAAGP